MCVCVFLCERVGMCSWISEINMKVLCLIKSNLINLQKGIDKIRNLLFSFEFIKLNADIVHHIYLIRFPGISTAYARNIENSPKT